MKSLYTFTLSLSCLLITFPQAADYYVSPNGLDEATRGSSAQPWKTLAYASTKVQAGTIHLSAGHFIETVPSKIAVGVNILGAGMVSTTIRMKNAYEYFAEFKPERFLIQLRSDTWPDSLISPPSVFSNFTMEGISDTGLNLSGGIVVEKRSQLKVDRVQFKNISWCALWLMEAKNVTIDSCIFLECANESNSYSSGALQLSHVENVEVKNFNIRAFNPGTGYGIAAMGFGIPRASWKKVRIHHGAIELKGTAAWQNGTAANISIEANLTWPIENSEIYNCTINNQISLPGGPNMIRTGKPTMRIHHNYFPILTTPGKAGNYTLELSLDDAEVDNNYTEGGSFFISGFYEPRVNVKIHHNLVLNMLSLYEWSIICGKATDLFIYNNTFHWNQGAPDWSIVGLRGDINRLIFQNNVIQVEDSIATKGNRIIKFIDNATWDGSKYSVQQLSVRNNTFHNASFDTANWPGHYSYNTQTRANFTTTGTNAWTYYVPKNSNGNLTDKGSRADLVDPFYIGKEPDIGAFEFIPPTQFSQQHPIVPLRANPEKFRPLQHRNDMNGRSHSIGN